MHKHTTHTRRLRSRPQGIHGNEAGVLDANCTVGVRPLNYRQMTRRRLDRLADADEELARLQALVEARDLDDGEPAEARARGFTGGQGRARGNEMETNYDPGLSDYIRWSTWAAGGCTRARTVPVALAVPRLWGVGAPERFPDGLCQLDVDLRHRVPLLGLVVQRIARVARWKVLRAAGTRLSKYCSTSSVSV